MNKEKQKAVELLDKYSLLVPIEFGGMDKELAKKCAKIVVDEIIKACEYNNVESYNTDWWNKVKQEINNL